MLRFYELFSAGDPVAFAEQITAEEEPFVMGTDWDQWTVGRDGWLEGYAIQIAEIPGLRFEAGARLAGWADGGVGWAADQPDLVFPDGSVVPVRATAVFRQEGGGWRLVNLHVSFGVPDAKLEELLPQLLP